MYVINNFMYGHNMSKNKKLNNFIHDFDIEFDGKTINGVEYQVDCPYHGGQVLGDTYSVMFGVFITYDDQNPSYVEEVRNTSEDKYNKGYQEFIKLYLENLDEYIEETKSWGKEDNWSEGDKKEFEKTALELKKFLTETEPEFYSVESSS